MAILGYGEFDSFDFWEMFSETLPFVLRWIYPALLAYVFCSFVAERIPIRGIAIFLMLVIFIGLSPTMFVMGAYGPAHVGAQVGWLAWPFLWGVLILKVIFLWRQDHKDKSRKTLEDTNTEATAAG